MNGTDWLLLLCLYLGMAVMFALFAFVAFASAAMPGDKPGPVLFGVISGVGAVVSFCEVVRVWRLK